MRTGESFRSADSPDLETAVKVIRLCTRGIQRQQEKPGKGPQLPTLFALTFSFFLFNYGIEWVVE